MPRKRAAKNCTITYWLSARQDCKEGRFVQVGNSLLLSEVFASLTYSARMMYLCLAMESGGKPIVTMSHSAAKKKYHIAPTTYDNAIKELIKKGFVEQIIDSNRYQYQTNRFRFSSAWKVA